MSKQADAKSPEISIILTSHNGASKLRTTLPELFKAMKGVDGAELILVDNASTDETENSLACHKFEARARIISEPRKGKSYGLNRGIDAARGHLIIFIDDDVRPIESWLKAFYDASARFPNHNVFAGQVRPDWPHTPPSWLKYLTDIGSSFGCTALDRAEGLCSYTQAKGANFMIRRSALENGARFDEGDSNYGAPGSAGGEDTRFIYDVLSGGEKLVMFIPDAIAFHAIRPHEMRMRAVLRRYRRIGRSSAMRMHSLGKTNELANFSKVIKRVLKSIRNAAALNLNEAARQAVQAAMCYGEWIGGKSLRGTSEANVSTE
jgi:glycosyltransferase involved in cell wall biosynthesis